MLYFTDCMSSHDQDLGILQALADGGNSGF